MRSTKEIAKKIARKSGITLISLIVTIIVLLILAGVSINLVVGQNGVITRAQESSEKSGVAGFAEEANLVYVDIAGEKVESNPLSSDVTLQEVVAKLTDPSGDYKEKILVSGVDGIAIEPEELTVTLGEKDGENFKTKSAKAQVVLTGSGIRYFAEINGVYYEMKLDTDNDKITLGNKMNNLPDGCETWDSGSWNITCTSSNSDIEATVDKYSMEVKASSNKFGTGDITVNYKNGSLNYSATLKVTFDHIIGKAVHFNDGNDITLGNGTKIKDNWKLFYYDNSNVYLIYGDYYPVTIDDSEYNAGTNKNVQTGGVTYVNLGDEEYKRAIYSPAGGRIYLLKYLRNDTNYDLSDYYNNEKINPYNESTSYKSWIDLKNGLNGTELGSQVIGIQGSPDFTMWCNSWNKKGYTKITPDRASSGFRVKKGNNDEDATIDYNTSMYWEMKDYNDTLYFPYCVVDDNSNAYGYWIASPSALSDYAMGARCNYGVGNNNFGYNGLSARPVVSVSKSDFITYERKYKKDIDPKDLKLLEL